MENKDMENKDMENKNVYVRDEEIVHPVAEKTNRIIQMNEGGFNQWSIHGSNKYVPTMPTIDKIPAGFYEIKQSSQIGRYLEKKNVNTDELYSLPNPELLDIINDIEKFWNRKEIYLNYGFLHKRGILMYGDPGNGKSGIIQLCSQYLIREKQGIIINISSADDISEYNEIIGPLRLIEKDRPLIVILEDIDAIVGEGSWAASLLLNLLDGVKQIDNVVYIATTNYPEKLEERISNRPSRFDRRYEIGMPESDVREAYFRNKLKSKDIKGIDIKDWIKRTEGMSLAHLKELIISVFALGNTFDDSLNRLNGMKIKPRIKNNGKSLGFNSD